MDTEDVQQETPAGRDEALAALLRIGQEIAAGRGAQELLTFICREAARLLGARSARLYTWGEGRRVAVLTAAHPPRGPHHGESWLLAGLLQAQEPQRKSLDQPDLSPEWRAYLQAHGGQSVLILPLLAQEDLLGYLELWEDAAGDELLARVLAGLAAVALERARLAWRGQQQLRTLRRAYEDVQQTEEQLIRAQKMEVLGLLSAGVAHDFNNLLTIISLYTEQALQDLLPSSPLYPDLEEVRQATTRATVLIRQLLVFSRRQQIKRQPLNLGLRVATLSKVLRRLTREDVRIQIDLPGEIWPVYADPGGIEQILINLVMNARDAMPHGGSIRLALANVEGIETTEAAQAGPHVRLSVEDTGTGMDPETLERIFDPFFTTKAPGRGTGLGLAVVQNIVQRHDGWIDVQSRPGQGSRFDVYLPALPGVERSAESLDRASPPAGHGQKILLVEDNTPLRRALAHSLREAGYTVFTAESSEEAQALFVQERGEIDLLLSDVILPGERGYQLAQTLQAGRPQIGVLLISGYVEDRAEWDEIEERGYPLLEKPFGIGQLLQQVYEILKDVGTLER
ncbi:MAG: response regulator [Chloroflexia bacterium]|nr:response regulator [Chloroflexia bacterium]